MRGGTRGGPSGNGNLASQGFGEQPISAYGLREETQTEDARATGLPTMLYAARRWRANGVGLGGRPRSECQKEPRQATDRLGARGCSPGGGRLAVDDLREARRRRRAVGARLSPSLSLVSIITVIEDVPFGALLVGLGGAQMHDVALRGGLCSYIYSDVYWAPCFSFCAKSLHSRKL
jgi:hypothetical protein